MATKVAALARPFRRGIHSTSCSRIASSSAPRYNSQNSDPDLTQSLQRDPAASQSALQTTNKLTNILGSIVENSRQKDFGTSSYILYCPNSNHSFFLSPLLSLLYRKASGRFLRARCKYLISG